MLLRNTATGTGQQKVCSYKEGWWEEKKDSLLSIFSNIFLLKGQKSLIFLQAFDLEEMLRTTYRLIKCVSEVFPC